MGGTAGIWHGRPCPNPPPDEGGEQSPGTPGPPPRPLSHGSRLSPALQHPKRGGPSVAGTAELLPPGPPARYGHAHPTHPRLSGARGGTIQKFGFGRTRWSTPVFRTAVRFRSAPFSPLPPCREPNQGLQWFRRGARRMTEACSVRANP